MTKFENQRLGEAEMRFGVPRGSVLGLLLFLTYINDINFAVSSLRVILFADDTSIIESGTCRERLNEHMGISEAGLKDWFGANRLALNGAVWVRYLKGENVHAVKFLGIYLDPTLKFDEHIDHMAHRLSKSIFLLKNLKRVLPEPSLLQTFHGVFQSVACHGSLAWPGDTLRGFSVCRGERSGSLPDWNTGPILRVQHD